MTTSGNSSNFNVHISVVTVVSNDLNGLKKSRLSLESQTFRNWSHVIVDSGKDQNIFNYLRDLPNMNSKWISEGDFGIYNAMNKALLMIEAESYVFFLNAGDVFANLDSLEAAAHALSEANFPNWGCTTHEEVAENGEGWICKLVSKPSITNQLYATGYRSHQGVIMKCAFIRSLGGFDEAYQVAADWDLIVKAILAETPTTWNLSLACFETGGFSSQRILLAHQELHQLRKIHLLKKPTDHIYDYLWRSLFLAPIGYHTLITRFLFFAFPRRVRKKKGFVRTWYRKNLYRQHGIFVRVLPKSVRRFWLKILLSVYLPSMRPRLLRPRLLRPRLLRHGLFPVWSRFLTKRLKIKNIEAA